MKSINKIRERDLDDSLLKKLFNSGAAVNLDSVLTSYLKKTDIILESNIPQSYTQAWKTRINQIQTQLDGLQRQYGSLSGTGNLQTDLTNLQNRLNALEQAINGFRNADGTTLADTVKQHTNQISVLNSAVVGLQNDVNAIKETIKSLPSSDKLANLTKMIDELENKTGTMKNDIEEDLSSVFRRKDAPIKRGDLDGEITRILDEALLLTSKISMLENSGRVLTGNEGEFVTFNSYGNPQGVPLFHTDTYFCNSPASAQSVMADDDESVDVYDFSTGTLYYRNPDYNSSQKYLSTTHPDTVKGYKNALLYDNSSGKLRFLLEGQFVEPYRSMYSKTCTVPAGGSVKLSRGNALTKPPVTFLVKDTDSTSRTKGKYINGEAVATIAYENDGYTIYNDDGAAHEFIVLGSE